MQKVLVFDYYNGKLYDNVQELNEFLANGWKVISQAAAANGNHIIICSRIGSRFSWTRNKYSY